MGMQHAMQQAMMPNSTIAPDSKRCFNSYLAWHAPQTLDDASNFAPPLPTLLHKELQSAVLRARVQTAKQQAVIARGKAALQTQAAADAIPPSAKQQGSALPEQMSPVRLPSPAPYVESSD